ncbi:hypothetical protein, partial [Mycolicibacterium sp. CBMA 226]|uniref:hypothetical protein n=1 Tax=Mycolicibacterium sp. CBMA 226 TaxID=2606611 RepID=UPI001AA1150F
SPAARPCRMNTQYAGIRDRNTRLEPTTLLNQKGCCIDPLKPPERRWPSAQGERQVGVILR